MPVDRGLLARPTLDAARSLLGSRLVRDDATGRRVARIVELEAYIGIADRASHARFGPTARNSVMFGPPGVAYVYLVYGMYDCLNVITEPEGTAAALLVRAAAPLEGLELMRADRLAHARLRRHSADPARRAAESRRLEALAAWRLLSGPGLVAAAFGLDRTWTGTDLCDPRSGLRLEPVPPDEPAPTILAAPRIGIAYAGKPWTTHPWRFLIAGDPAVSGSGAR